MADDFTTVRLSASTAFPAAATTWGMAKGLLTSTGGNANAVLVNNLSDIPNKPLARLNMGLEIGSQVQGYSSVLTLYAAGPNPSAYSLGLLNTPDLAGWRTALGITAGNAGTVTSVQINASALGFTVAGGPITSSGTLTLGGALNVANGGTGSTSLSALKVSLALNNVDNTSDINKPISTAVQNALNTKTTLPTSSPNTIIGWNTDGSALANYTMRAKLDRFTTGTTTGPFTLTGNPGYLENIRLNLSGVEQVPGIDFTWDAGAGLSFTTVPPAAGIAFTVRYNEVFIGSVNSTATQVTTTPFTGTLIPDGSTVQSALQVLETATESTQATVADLEAQVDDLMAAVVGPMALSLDGTYGTTLSLDGTLSTIISLGRPQPTVVAPTNGTAVAGQTTIVAPLPTPADSPWWSDVWINGVIQKPGVDFLSNGSYTLTLTTPLASGDLWQIRSYQRE